jgi:hypothetical protein
MMRHVRFPAALAVVVLLAAPSPARTPRSGY